MQILVDTYEGYLNNVEVQLFDSPYTTLGTFSGAAITAIEGGSYKVEVGAITGNWRVILRDSNNESLGIKYANPNNLFATDNPPWNSTVIVSGAITLTEETSEDDVVYFYNQSPVTKVFLTETDLSATPLDFVIEKEDKSSICEVLAITPGTESVSVSIPSIAVQTDKCFTWSLRYASTNTVVKSGPAIYRYAPIKAQTTKENIMADVTEVVQVMTALGPKKVETKEFNVEQFNPLDVQKLLDRRAPHPTFGSMTRVKVEPLNKDHCACDCVKDDTCGDNTCY